GIPGIECGRTFLRWQQLSESKIASDSTLTEASSNRSQSRTNESLACRLSKNAASSTSYFGSKADIEARCPLYPQKRTLVERVGMSALCQKQTLSYSFDQIVGAALQRHRNGEAERLRGLEVDDELDFRGLLNRQIGGLFAFEDAAGVDADLAKQLRNIGSIAHQTTGRGELAIRTDRGNRMAKCLCAELL